MHSDKTQKLIRDFELALFQGKHVVPQPVFERDVNSLFDGRKNRESNQNTEIRNTPKGKKITVGIAEYDGDKPVSLRYFSE